MISSNYEILLFKANTDNNLEKITSKDFLNSVENALNKNKKRDNSLSFENIKGITLDEIDELFKDDTSKNLAKNLKLATMFTEDEKLSKILFNTVLGKPFDSGLDYIINRYDDKNSYLKSKSSSFGKNTLFDLLHKSLEYRLSSDKVGVSKEDLDDILLSVQSFDFLGALSSSSKKGSQKYKDDDKYSFLYRNYEQEYKDLLEKYDNFDKANLNIIKQF